MVKSRLANMLRPFLKFLSWTLQVMDNLAPTKYKKYEKVPESFMTHLKRALCDISEIFFSADRQKLTILVKLVQDLSDA